MSCVLHNLEACHKSDSEHLKQGKNTSAILILKYHEENPQYLSTIHSAFTDKHQQSLLLERWEELARKYFVPYVSFTTHWRSVRRTLQVNIAWDSDNLQYTENTDCRWPNYHYKHLLAPDSSPDAGGCHLLLNHVPEDYRDPIQNPVVTMLVNNQWSWCRNSSQCQCK